MRIPTRLLAPLLLALPLQAQGGFTPGELVLYTPALTGVSSSDGGIVRIDPSTGTVTLLLDLAATQTSPGSMTYDPYRDRVLFVGKFPTVSDPTRVWLIDAAGGTTELAAPNATYTVFTPASGGRIYFRTNDSNSPFRYFDAANGMHDLLDASGSAPFKPPGSTPQAMVYDPGTNSLVMALQSNTAWNCGTTVPAVTVQRVPLSLDGTRVEGPTACLQVPVDPGGGSVPVGLSRRPDGKLLLVADTSLGGDLPRMNLIDPGTMTATPWASNGYFGDAATNAGTWSSVLDRAVILDTWNDVLRSYAQGASGTGTLIMPSSMISAGGSGEVATLVEIPFDGCNALVGTYCTAKVTSGGCTPVISTTGDPSATAGSGFTISADDVEPGNVGIFFYGHSGPSAVPFLGGFLCVQPPTWRTAPQSSGGTAACSGSYAIDFNAYVAGSADPQLLPAAVIHGQFWFRDPPAPVGGSGLSGGVTFTLCP